MDINGATDGIEHSTKEIERTKGKLTFDPWQ